MGSFLTGCPHFSEMGLVQLAEGTGLTPGYVTVSEGGDKVITISGVNLAKDGATFTTDDPSIATVTGQDAVESTVKYSETSVSYSTLAGSNTSWTKTKYFYKAGSNYYPVYAYREYSYGYYCVYGYSITDDSDNVQRIGYGYGTYTVNLYKKSGTEAIPASTTITFHGVKAGAKTYANIGGVRYEITVTEKAIVSGNTIIPPLQTTSCP